MGELVGPGAGIPQIRSDIEASHRAAVERKGDVEAKAKEILGPVLGLILSAAAAVKAANELVVLALTHLLAVDEMSDKGIKAVRDGIFNAVGRTLGHPAMAHVFGEGVKTFTEGDPRRQPILMKILQGLIMSMPAPTIHEDTRKGWVAQIEALIGPHEEAAKALMNAEGQEMIAESGYRAQVRSGLLKLRSFKRALKDLGMTEAQIHEIIPDAGGGGSAKGKKDGGKDSKGSGDKGDPKNDK